MSGARALAPVRLLAPVRDRAAAVALGAMAVALSFCGIFIAAGGLGLAVAFTLAGLGALVAVGAGAPGLPPVAWARLPTSLLLFGALGLWATLSITWSPHSNPDRALLMFPTVLAGAAILAVAGAAQGAARRRLTLAFVFAGVSAATLLGLAMLTDYGLAKTHHVDRPIEEVYRSLGHGVSALVAFTPGTVAILLTRGGRLGLGFAVVAALSALAGGVLLGLSSNVLGLLALGVFALLAAWRVAVGLWAAGIAAAGSLLVAPLLGLVAVLIPPGLLEQLPFTWAQRLKIWRYTAESLPDGWLFGHGFDAAREVSDTLVLKDFEFSAIPLHPHNAGLHLWYEVGLVGVLLAAAAILFGVHRIARAPGLSRIQGIAAAGFIGGYAGMAAVSYGVWQEWWIAAAVLGGAGLLLLGPPRSSVVR